MVSVDVRQLGTDRIVNYGGEGMTPEQAVINAYAQYDRKDWNTWDYGKYAHLVRKGKFCVSCGDYSAFMDGRRLTTTMDIPTGDKIVSIPLSFIHRT